MQEIIDAGPATATDKKQVGTGNENICYSGSLVNRTVYNTPSSEREIRGGLTGLALVSDWIKRNRSEDLKCPYCGAKLRADDLQSLDLPENAEYFWMVPGIPEKQWLYIPCSSWRCGKDINLAKIGIFSDKTFLNEDGVEVLRP